MTPQSPIKVKKKLATFCKFNPDGKTCQVRFNDSDNIEAVPIKHVHSFNSESINIPEFYMQKNHNNAFVHNFLNLDHVNCDSSTWSQQRSDAVKYLMNEYDEALSASKNIAPKTLADSFLSAANSQEANFSDIHKSNAQLIEENDKAEVVYADLSDSDILQLIKLRLDEYKLDIKAICNELSKQNIASDKLEKRKASIIRGLDRMILKASNI